MNSALQLGWIDIARNIILNDSTAVLNERGMQSILKFGAEKIVKLAIGSEEGELKDHTMIIKRRKGRVSDFLSDFIMKFSSEKVGNHYYA